MSDPIVTTIFKTRLGSLADVPCIDVLNVRPATLPDVFTSVERDHSTTSRITLGTPTQFREEGVINVVVHVRAGQGSAAAEALTEQVRDLFHNYSVGNLQVYTVDSGVVISPDDGNFFELKVPVGYMFDFFKP